MSSLARRSRKLAAGRAVLLSSCALFACEFPNYAFPSDRAGASTPGGSGGGVSGVSAGGARFAGSGNAGAEPTSGGASGNSGASAGWNANGGLAHGGGPALDAGAAGQVNAGGGSGGGLLFSDDFESGKASGWTANTPNEWSIVSLGSNHVYKEGTKVDGLCVTFAGSNTWADQVLEAKINVLTFGGSTTSDLAFLAVRFRDADNFYYAALRSDGKVVLKARLNGSDGSLGASVSAGIKTNTWYTVKVSARGEALSVYVDGALIQTVSGVLIASGAIALGTNNSTAEFDDVSLTAP